jgi:hypothetical protein
MNIMQVLNRIQHLIFKAPGYKSFTLFQIYPNKHNYDANNYGQDLNSLHYLYLNCYS